MFFFSKKEISRVPNRQHSYDHDHSDENPHHPQKPRPHMLLIEFGSREYYSQSSFHDQQRQYEKTDWRGRRTDDAGSTLSARFLARRHICCGDLGTRQLRLSQRSLKDLCEFGFLTGDRLSRIELSFKRHAGLRVGES